MKSVFIVYKTDSWHSYASRDTIGIATGHSIAIDLCKKQAKKEHAKIDTDQLHNLMAIKQTQGYSGEGEFQIESVDLNILL